MSCIRIEELSNNNFFNEASTSTNSSGIFRGRIEDYTLGKEIGKGAYATVRKAVHKATNIKIAAKIYSKQNLLDPQRKNAVKREIDILKKTDHPNIMKLHEVIDGPKNTILVMELIEGNSMLSYLKGKPNRRTSEEEAKEFFKQIIQGIEYLHSKHLPSRYEARELDCYRK